MSNEEDLCKKSGSSMYHKSKGFCSRSSSLLGIQKVIVAEEISHTCNLCHLKCGSFEIKYFKAGVVLWFVDLI